MEVRLSVDHLKTLQNWGFELTFILQLNLNLFSSINLMVNAGYLMEHVCCLTPYVLIILILAISFSNGSG